VAHLIAAGFVSAKQLRSDVAEAVRPKGIWQRVRALFSRR
jgi:hypothetical protein